MKIEKSGEPYLSEIENFGVHVDFSFETLKFLRELLKQCIGVFLFSAVPVFGIAWTISRLSIADSIRLQHAVGVGAMGGLFAVLYCGISLRSVIIGTICDILVRRACKLDVHGRQAIAVMRADSGLETILIDCGEKTLAITGGWWHKSSSHGLLIQGVTDKIPATSMSIVFFPTAGRALSVTTYGPPLSLKHGDSLQPPILKTILRKGADFTVINKTIENTIVAKTDTDSTHMGV